MLDIFGYFRRRRSIGNLAALANFIDENAAFLVQKGIYEYARARAGHYSKVLFAEPGFQQAVEISRWRAYPLGLAMVAETTEGLLRLTVGEDKRAHLDSFSKLVLAVFDKYPVPAALSESAWREMRVELARRLQLIGLHPPKRAKDVPEQFARNYFDLMPIHAKLRSAEYPTTRNYLRVTMCNIHDELTKRIDAPTVADMLRAQTV